MPKLSYFRAWVNQLWVENCEEHLRYAEPRLDQKEYFQRYKYWLKRQYKQQRKLEQKAILDKLSLDQKLAQSYNHNNTLSN